MSLTKKNLWLYTWKILPWVVLGIGFAIQLATYLDDRSFWHDEVLLAINIIQRPVLGLFEPLESYQVAPIGYLLVVKAAFKLFGSSELALRLPSLLAGAAGLVFFGMFTRRMLNRPGQVIAASLLAGSFWTIYFSSELKPYAFDAASASAIYLVFALLLEPHPRRRTWLAAGGVGVMVIWLSYSSIFVLAAAGLALLIEAALPLVKNKRLDAPEQSTVEATRKAICLVWLGAAWAASFLGSYLVSIGRESTSPVLLNYWQTSFMPLPPWSNLAWFSTAFTNFFNNPVKLPLELAGPLVLAGLAGTFRKDWRWGLALSLPLVFCLAASGLGKYPFSERLLLFLLPGLFAALAAGIVFLASLLSQAGTRFLQVLSAKKSSMAPVIINAVLILGMAAVVLTGPIQGAISQLSNPYRGEDIKPMLAELAKDFRQGDILYLYYGAANQYTFYAPVFHLENIQFVLAKFHRDRPELYQPEIAALAGNQRVWVLFSHIYYSSSGSEEDLFLSYLDKLGKRIQENRASGASLFLYDMRP